MYLAQDRLTKAQRCVKFYLKGAPNAPVEDILFEFEVMKSLDSPHVARTYEIFQDSWPIYFFLVVFLTVLIGVFFLTFFPKLYCIFDLCVGCRWHVA